MLNYYHKFPARISWKWYLQIQGFFEKRRKRVCDYWEICEGDKILLRMVMRQAGSQRSCYWVERAFTETGIRACHRKREAFRSERLFFFYGMDGNSGKISPYPAPDVQGTVKGAVSLMPFLIIRLWSGNIEGIINLEGQIELSFREVRIKAVWWYKRGISTRIDGNFSAEYVCDYFVRVSGERWCNWWEWHWYSNCDKKEMDNQIKKRFISWAADMDIRHERVFSIVDIQEGNMEKWERIFPFYQNIRKEGIVLWRAA